MSLFGVAGRGGPPPWGGRAGLAVDFVAGAIAFALGLERYPWQLAALVAIAVGALSYSSRRTLATLLRVYSPLDRVESADEATAGAEPVEEEPAGEEPAGEEPRSDTDHGNSTRASTSNA